MTRKQRRASLIGAGLVILAAAVGLVLTALQDNIVFFYSPSDIAERERWDEYMHAYEEAIRNTARDYAPWHVVPSDNKWFARMVIAATIVEALERIDPKFPEVSDDAIERMKEARVLLRKELGLKD